jgi:hypothetical protein
MVFNATFSNILVISWWSVLLVEETGVPGENHRSVSSKKLVYPEKITDLSQVRNFSPGTAVSYLRQVGDFLRVHQFLT